MRKPGARRCYFAAIAEAHFVIRTVFRIVDEQARRAGLDPLAHKVLIQAHGAPTKPLRVNDLASRLDIAPALASRLVNVLERRGLVSRSRDARDRRVIQVASTAAGADLLAAIDRKVRQHVDSFQSQLTDAERDGAMRIFALYLGKD